MHVNYLLTFKGKMAYLFGVSPTFLYFCRQMMKQQYTLLYIFLLPCLLMVGTLCACSGDKKQMQQQLLSLQSKFEKGTLSSKDFSLADSLVRCYEGRENRDEALSLLITGDIYKTSGDYSTSLDYYLKANKVSENLDDLLLQIWINRGQGDLYFEQGMYSECIEYYRKSYAAALQRRDTLRIALGAYSMARVYMIKNDVDSILFYLNQDIELATKINNDDVLRAAQSTLADIYTQIGEYYKAEALMVHDQRDEHIWAYWHLAQHHTDSAYWYFSRIIENKPWKTKVEYLPILAKLEEERGNREHSLSLYRDLAAAKDSLQVHSQVEKTRKVKILHEFNQIKQERDEAQEQSKVRGIAISLICLVVAIVALTAYSAWKRYREQKERELTQERLLRQEEERIRHQSVRQIEENKQKIAQLEQQLAEARQRNDIEAADRIRLDAEMLTAENQSIEATQRRREYALKEFQKTDIYMKLKLHSGEEDVRMSEDEWQQLAQHLDEIYDDFTHRLLALVNMTDVELKACYLLKLDVSPIMMSTLLCRSKSAVTMLRKRLYEKITHKDGTAKQLDEFILGF